MKRTPLAYYITFVTHGFSLQGRDVVSSDSQHDDAPYLLDATRRRVVRDTIREVCDYRDWTLWAMQVRSEQVHVVVTADIKPDTVIKDFKAYSGRRLKKKLREPLKVKRWSPDGAGFFVLEADELRAEIAYTLHGQGAPMEVFDGTKEANL